MIKAKELKQWLKAIPDDDFVAIDDGGLTLCHIFYKISPCYIEIGGIVTDEDCVGGIVTGEDCGG
jgi:hypothetical protein